MSASAGDWDQSKAYIAAIILFIHVLAWLVWMLISSWRRKKVFLVGSVGYSAYCRESQPVGFWAGMLFYSLLAAFLLWMICFSIAKLATTRAHAQLAPYQELNRNDRSNSVQ